MKKREAEYLDMNDRGFLATVGPRGSPTIVPICFARSKGVLYTAVDEKPKSTKNLARVRNIQGRNRVAFIVDNYSSNWATLSYLLVHGRARIVKDGKEAEMARTLLVERYPQYRWLGFKRSMVIAITIRSARFWALKKPARATARRS